MSDKFPRLSFRLIFIILTFSFIVGYVSENTRKLNQLMSDARKLNNTISEPFDYASTIGIYLGKQIADNNKFEDYKYIENLFRETVRMQGSSRNIISWSMFSWGDKKHRLQVNTMYGISKVPESLVSRNYTWRARYEPWALQLAKPDRGVLSRTWILPSAVGVTNSRDEFMGTVIMGLNVKEILARAEEVMTSGNAFILANRDSFNQDEDKMIFASSNTPFLAKDYKKIPELVDKCRDWIDQSGAMPTNLKAGRFKFSYYSIIEGYPLVIFVGFNRLEFWGSVFATTIRMAILLTVFVMLALEVRRRRMLVE